MLARSSFIGIIAIGRGHHGFDEVVEGTATLTPGTYPVVVGRGLDGRTMPQRIASVLAGVDADEPHPRVHLHLPAEGRPLHHLQVQGGPGARGPRPALALQHRRAGG